MLADMTAAPMLAFYFLHQKTAAPSVYFELDTHAIRTYMLYGKCEFTSPSLAIRDTNTYVGGHTPCDLTKYSDGFFVTR